MTTKAKEIQRTIAARRAAPGCSGSSKAIVAEYTVALPVDVPYNRGPIDAPDGASSLRQEVSLSLVTSKKASVERGASTERSTRAKGARRPVVAAPRPRARSHTLAPEHIGEAGSVAVLTLAILGLSTFIAAIALIVFGLTTAGSYGATPPPNAGSLGMGQMVGGFGLLIIGLLLLGSSLAVLADVRGSRRAAAAVAAATALLSVVGVVLVMRVGVGDAVLAAALAVCALLCAASAFILARPAH